MPRPRLAGSVTKTPGEKRIVNLTFDKLMASGAVITGQVGVPTITDLDNGTITIDSITFSGQVAQLTIDGGSAVGGVNRHVIEFVVLTDTGQELEGALTVCVQSVRSITLVVQTDPPVDNANSYATIAGFKAYHLDRGRDICTMTEEDIASMLILATDYVDTRFRFPGEQERREHRTQWPRFFVTDNNEKHVAGVPLEIVEAVYEYALIAFNKTERELYENPTLDDTGRIVQKKRERVDVIEESIEYVGGAQFVLPKYPRADQKLFSRGLALKTRNLKRS